MGGAKLTAGFSAQESRPTVVKICGVTEAEHVIAAAEAGASYIGFNFVPPSPRYVAPARAAELAGALARASDRIVSHVGLFANAPDAEIEAALEVAPIDLIQLHGDEPPERIAEARSRFGLPVMKAIPISGPEDIEEIERFGAVADLLLVDAKPPRGAALTGGAGVSFDWSLLDDVAWPRPWMLAGGLNPHNVRAAIAATRAPIVDVSSGVEASRGVKDPAKIRAFVEAAQSAR